MAIHTPADPIDDHAACTCGACSAQPLSPHLQQRWHDGHRKAEAANTPTTAGLSAKAAAETIGISYRQLDYWARTGLVTPTLRPGLGSGSKRRYSDTDIELGRLVAAFARAGSLETARRRIDVLRQLVNDPNRPHGVYLTVDTLDVTTTPPASAAWWLPLPAAA